MAINKTEFIWMDGKFLPWDDAKTHVLDHSLHYGSAVFEGIRGYKIDDRVAIFRIDDHIDRLFKSANALKIKISYNKEQLKEIIIELVKKNRMKNDFYIRPLIWLGSGDLKALPSDNPTRVMIAVFERDKYFGADKELKVKISPYMKPRPESFPSGVKVAGAYVNSMLAQMDAKGDGYDDAIILDHRGLVVEGTAGNIFLVKNNTLLTPSLETGIIPGITRDSIIEMANDLQLNVEETDIKVEQLFSADEVFLTGTALEITSINEIDEKQISNTKTGRISEEIRREYTDIVRGRKNKYSKWLTFI